MGWSWLNRPLWPFLLVLVSPMLTAPISLALILSIPDCGLDEPWWELPHFQRALLPGLVDLLPFLWLVSAGARVRKAAIIAGLIGVARFTVPQVSVALYAGWSGGQASDPACNVSSFFLAAVLIPTMVALWLVSALLIAAILNRTGWASAQQHRR